MEYVPEILESYNNKLKSQLFGLLCERERERDWESFLDSILIELEGFDVDERTIDYYSIYHKLASCRYLSYKYFRKTIFDCMSLLSRTEEARR
jgi:hypothetical protein